MSSSIHENPFLRLPSGFDPDRYYGSARWVCLLLEQISAPFPGSLELLGLPGMGKSTLLRYISHPQGALVRHSELLAPPFSSEPSALLPIMIQFRLSSSDMHPFVYMYQRFHKEYRGYRSRVSTVAGGTLPVLEEVEPVQLPDVAAGLMGKDIQALARRGVRTALLLDDFDLAVASLTGSETDMLRPWREWTAFVLATERRFDDVNREASGSPFFQTLTTVYMGGLTAEEARRLLSEPAEAAGNPFPADDVEYVQDQAGGHPYLAILGGRSLWDLREQLGLHLMPTPLSTQQRAVLKGRLLAEFRGWFDLYWDRLNAAERQALLAPLTESEPTLDQYALFGPLAERGLMRYNSHRGRYEPFSPLFAEHLLGRQGGARIPIPSAFTGLEESLYQYLRDRIDRVCTYEDLWQNVWKRPVPAAPGGLDQARRRMQVAVSRLRAKIPDAAQESIVSVRGQGYRLVRTTSEDNNGA
jgi:hypothetical protein